MASRVVPEKKEAFFGPKRSAVLSYSFGPENAYMSV